MCNSPFSPELLSHRVLPRTIQIRGRLPVNNVIYVTIYLINRLVHLSRAGRASKQLTTMDTKVRRKLPISHDPVEHIRQWRLPVTRSIYRSIRAATAKRIHHLFCCTCSRAETTIAFGVCTNCSQEINSPEVWPKSFTEIKLRVSALPQKKPRQALLTGCANH